MSWRLLRNQHHRHCVHIVYSLWSWNLTSHDKEETRPLFFHWTPSYSPTQTHCWGETVEAVNFKSMWLFCFAIQKQHFFPPSEQGSRMHNAQSWTLLHFPKMHEKRKRAIPLHLLPCFHFYASLTLVVYGKVMSQNHDVKTQETAYSSIWMCAHMHVHLCVCVCWCHL